MFSKDSSIELDHQSLSSVMLRMWVYGVGKTARKAGPEDTERGTTIATTYTYKVFVVSLVQLIRT